MRARSLTALATVVMLTLAACGGDDGAGALSEDDFVDAMTRICEDTRRDLDQIDPPTENDASTFAAASVEVMEQTLTDIGEITPPEASARALDDFVDVIDDQIRALERIGDATSADEIGQGFERLQQLSGDQTDAAQDMDVEACEPRGGESVDTTVATTAETTVPETTAAPTTAAPVTTAAPITLPSTVAPAPPTSPTVPATAAPVGTAFEIIDLTAEGFVAPDGFYLVPKTPDQATIDLIATLPELDEKLLQLGVATLVETESDVEIADIWLGLSVTDSMPADWKTLDCPIGDLRTSGNGILGIVCEAALESPFWEIFTATDGDIGISVYTRVSDITGDLVADAFLAVN